MTADTFVTATSEPIANAHGFSGMSVVGLPASSDDPAVGQQRVYVGGVLTTRSCDSVLEQP